MSRAGRPLRWRGVLALLAGAGLLAGCGGGVTSLDLPVPPATVAGAPTTTVPGPFDGSAVNEAGVGGVTTTTAVALRPGSARIVGTVRGPHAAVAGATVELTRIVGSATAATTVTSGPGGHWSLTGVLGGRYRVRAWMAPQLAQTTPTILFVSSDQTAQVDLTMTRFDGPSATASYNPYPPVQGQPTAVRIEVATPTVGADGTVTYVPAPGRRVTLDGGLSWTVPSGVQTTGADGLVDVVATCNQSGAAPLDVTIGASTVVTLTTPVCAPAPPTTTTTTAPSTTTTTVPPSTTTSAPTTTTTTTTTVPVAPTVTVPSS